MKWLFAFLAVILYRRAAVAGEDPYIAIVNNDNTAVPFLLQPEIPAVCV